MLLQVQPIHHYTCTFPWFLYKLHVLVYKQILSVTAVRQPQSAPMFTCTMMSYPAKHYARRYYRRFQSRLRSLLYLWVGHYRHYRLYRCISRTTTRRGINKIPKCFSCPGDCKELSKKTKRSTYDSNQTRTKPWPTRPPTPTTTCRSRRG